ncbi:MAG TPA: carbon-nitrogen hydrolase [Geobacteraceae bacterium]|nr:carbon-nitrogen hydrolase [Geobacteraceae bacterium]
MNRLTIGLVQQSCDENRDVNLAKSIESIRKASVMGANLVVLQELHAGPYFCQCENPAFFDQAETIPGPTTDIFSGVAREFGVVIVISLFERRTAGLYHNTAVVFDKDGTIAGRYRKMHIPDDPLFYEKFYFAPGDESFLPVDTSVGRLGVLVCWDQWYPEAARLMALAGAELLIYPTAIGWDPNDDDEEKYRQKEAWITIQRSHSIANGIPLASVNRVGFEADPTGVGAGIDFWGNSFVVGPQGEFLAQAGVSEELLIVEIDKARSETVRRIWPFLRDRRIDAYGDLLKRYRD